MIQVRIFLSFGFCFTGSVSSISNSRHKDITVLLLLVGTTSCKTKIIGVNIQGATTVTLIWIVRLLPIFTKNKNKKKTVFTLQFLRSNLRVGGRSQWKRSSSRVRYSEPWRGLGRVFIQEITKGSHPSWDGSMKIIPQRLTVAGCNLWKGKESKQSGI